MGKIPKIPSLRPPDSRNPETSYRILKKFSDDRKIKCDHLGCPDEVQLQDPPMVVDECEFAPVVCGNERCGMVVNKSQKENHEIDEYKAILASKNEMEANGKIQVKQSFFCSCLYACYFNIFYVLYC